VGPFAKKSAIFGLLALYCFNHEGGAPSGLLSPRSATAHNNCFACYSLPFILLCFIESFTHSVFLDAQYRKLPLINPGLIKLGVI